MNYSRKKPLYGCVLCRDCTSKVAPKAVGILTPKDMVILGYSRCSIDNDNYLTEADRKCVDYREGRDEP